MQRLVSLLVYVAPVACRGQPPARALAGPSGAWRPVATPDSAAAFCLAPGYAPVPGSLGVGIGWARGAPGDSDYAFLSVDVLDSAAAALKWGTPPRPKPFGVPRAAFISGGPVGFRRQPALRAVWPVAGGRWVLVQGFASTPDELAMHPILVRLASAALTSARPGAGSGTVAGPPRAARHAQHLSRLRGRSRYRDPSCVRVRCVTSIGIRVLRTIEQSENNHHGTADR